MTREQFAENCNRFNDSYESIAIFHLETGKTITLGEGKEKRCRFCGKAEPEVAFETITHAVPEFTGNKSLISDYECDTCNKHFSKLETQMSRYMHLFHTMAQVKGKKGVPKYKINFGKSIIELGDQSLKVDHHEGDKELFEIKPDKNIMTMKGERSYVPQMVYKCLVKMALTIMPEEELQHFSKTLEWLMEDPKAKSKFHIGGLVAFMNTYPGPRPFDEVSCLLYRRRDNAPEKVPYCIFFIAYSNFTFQIYVPMCDKDAKYMKQDITLLGALNPLDYYGIVPTRENLDLSSSEKVIDEHIEFDMHYEFMTDTLLNPDTGEVISES